MSNIKYKVNRESAKNGKFEPQIDISKLPCNTCEWRYSIHCPKCEWNKKGKVKVY